MFSFLFLGDKEQGKGEPYYDRLCWSGTNVLDRDVGHDRISDTLAGISKHTPFPAPTPSNVPSAYINATMPKIKARAATKNDLEDRI